MNLESVTQLGRSELERQINPSLKVKLRTLTATEYAKVMRAAGSSGVQSSGQADLGTLGQLADLQIDTLSFATVSINEQTGTAEEFKKLYQTIQYPILMDIYQVYMEVLEGQNKVLDELKKNSVSNQPLEKTT